MGSEEVEVMKEEETRCGRLQKWLGNLPIPVCMTLCSDSLQLLPSRSGVDFFTLQSGLGHVTCYDHWDISKCDANRNLKSPCTLGLAFLAALGNPATATK